MGKIILVPTDHSKGAEKALEYAAALAIKTKSAIHLLHAFHVPPSMLSSGSATSELIRIQQKEESDKLKKICDRMSIKHGIVIKPYVQHGLAVDVILEAIVKKNPSLVIMGTKGAGWLKEILMGSNTARVIKKSKCPVIAVPDKAEYSGFQHIVYATDYHASDLAALRKIVSIAKLFDASITALHVADEDLTRETQEVLMSRFSKMVKGKIKYPKLRFQIARGQRLEKALQAYIAKEGPDMLAMSTHYRNLLDKLFGFSVTEKMAYHSRIPLLAFHHKKESIVFI